MNPLLEWGLSKSDPSALSDATTPAISAELLRDNKELMDQLLKSDVQRMKDMIAEATNTELEEEDRELALDELEMLVESIDNANDFATIKGIAPIMGLFNDPSTLVQLNAAWVLGTCAQNNARFTKAFLDESGLDELVALLRRSTHSGVLGKVTYAISGCVRASTEATTKAVELNAFETMIQLLATTADIQLKRKLAFLFGGIIFEQHTHGDILQHLLDKKLYETLIEGLKADDHDLQDKIFEALDAAFSASPAAVAHIKQGSLATQLISWCRATKLTAEQKASYSKTLSRAGLAV